MTFIGNVLWILVGGGLFIAMGYLFGGLVLCLTIVGIPFGLQCFKLAALALMPFGRTITDRVPPAGCLSIVMNVIWILVGGFWITVLHLAFALLCAVTIIGIPFAQQHLKLAALALTPFGRTFT